MKNKLFYLVFTLLLLLAMLAGCSFGKDGAPDVPGLIGEDGTTDYVIIRSDSSTEAVPYASSLKKGISERTGANLELATDFVAKEGTPAYEQYKERECEILVGSTVRELSNYMKEQLTRPLDWGIVREGSKIAIYGTDRLEEAVEYFLDNYVADRNIYIADGEQYFNMGAYELDSLTINGRDIREYSILFDTDNSYFGVIAQKLANDIYEMTGYKLAVEKYRITTEPVIYFGTVNSVGSGKAACYLNDKSLYAVCGANGNPYDSYSMLIDHIRSNIENKSVDISAELDLKTECNKSDVVGSSEEPKLWIYTNEDGIMVREAEFDSGLGGDPVTIVQVSDMHFNYCNQEDLDENDPVLMSTYENRKWLADGSSVANAIKCLDYADKIGADQIVVTGDTLDYLSKGALELMKTVLWDNYPDAIATLGNHEPVRNMQGKVAETLTLEERYAMLEAAWADHHDIYYYSKVIEDKVMVIQMDNCLNKYWERQVEPFKADLETAKEKGCTVLIFQHTPICSNNPDEAEVYPLRINDGSGVPFDYYSSGVGAKASGAAKEIYELITNNADVIRGIFCGHVHCDVYSEVLAKTSDGEAAIIPQYILTASAYDSGHVLKITVK